VSTRAALYLRVSLDRTGEGLAVDRQREDGEQLIKLRGWDLTSTYTDNDISAAGTKRRPGFEALMAAIESGAVDVVVAWSLDRLTRNRRDQLRLIEGCHRGGTNLALVRGSDMDLSSAVGRAVADILSTTARLENEQKSERQVRAIRQAAGKGIMVGGRRAFGYTDDGQHLHPTEAPLLVQAYDRFLDAGAPLGAIARWLNDQGVTTTRGNRWRVETVRVVLSNPRNAGLRALRSVDPKSGKRNFYHDAPVATGTWPAVITEERWRQALRRLQDPSRRSSPGNRPRHLLSGIAWCGVEGCGGRVYNSGAHGVPVLRCLSKHLSRRADPIETLVVEALLRRLSKPYAARLFTSSSDGVDVDDLWRRAAATRAKLAELEDDYRDPDFVMGREEYMRSRNQLQERLAGIDTEIAGLGRGDAVAPLRGAADPRPVWDQLDIDTQRAVVNQLMRVTVLPGRSGQPGGRRFDPASVDIRWLTP
jgi:DNA invertase Pin-like site-specific DNA recombinase